VWFTVLYIACKVVMKGCKVKCDNTQYIFMCCLPGFIGRAGSLNRRCVRVG
jgi:hypothetical protein